MPDTFRVTPRPQGGIRLSMTDDYPTPTYSLSEDDALRLVNEVMEVLRGQALRGQRSKPKKDSTKFRPA